MTLSKMKPLLTRLDDESFSRLRKFAKKKKIPMAQIVREAINMRVASGDRYVSGFNDGIRCAIVTVASSKASQIRFPSGKSFAELTEEMLDKQLMRDGTE